MDSDNENFDDEWINKYENEEKKYEVFYPEEVKYLKVNCLYVKENELEKITEKKINLSKENIIKKEELIKLIRENDNIDKTKRKKRKQKTTKQSVLWTVYHTILALELLVIIIIEGVELYLWVSTVIK